MNARTDSHRFLPGLAFVALAALLVAAGCGGKSDEAASTAAATAKATKKAPTAAERAATEETRLATAVITGKTSAPVDLKYDMAVKPAVGQPFEVELAFVTRLQADSLEVEATGMPGLTLVGNGAAKFDKVQANGTYTQKVLVQADANGTYYLSIVARMITQVQTEARTFSVPVVVGTAPAPIAKPAPAKDASGQPIEPMKSADH